MHILTKIKDKSIKDILNIIIAKFLTVSSGYRVNLTGLTELIEKSIFPYKLLQMDMSHLQRMKNLYSNELSYQKLKILEERICSNSKVQQPFVVIDDTGEICGYYHIAYGDTRDGTINRTIQVPKGAVYLFDDYTFFNKRGKGIHKFAILSRLNLAIELKCSEALVNIINGNEYSERSYRSMGFLKYVTYYYFHILEIKKTISKRK